MAIQEKVFIKGFNNGYNLAIAERDLAIQIVKNPSAKTDYLEGFLSGIQEYQLELSQAHTNELNHLRNKSQDRDKGHERD